MSILEFVQGSWTWGEIGRELAPLFSLSVTAFLAGYWRGRNVELSLWLKGTPHAD